MGKKNPEAGTLIKLVSRLNCQRNILVGNIPDDDNAQEFAPGTLAVIVGQANLDENYDGGTVTPLILVNGFLGWIYNDEWEPLGES